MGQSLMVVVERQDLTRAEVLSFYREYRIGFTIVILCTGKIARIGFASIDMGILYTILVKVIGSAHASYQAPTNRKHPVCTSNIFSSPAIAHNDRLDIAPTEHIVHLRHIARVKTTQIQQTLFSIEFSKHERHIGHISCVEMAQVKVSYKIAIREHISHNGHRTGVQVVETLDGF